MILVSSYIFKLPYVSRRILKGMTVLSKPLVEQGNKESAIAKSECSVPTILLFYYYRWYVQTASIIVDNPCMFLYVWNSCFDGNSSKYCEREDGISDVCSYF